MNFVESIQTCFRKYATFEGRAARPEYWWFVLFLVLTQVVAEMVSPTLSGIFVLATLLPAIAAAARRLHDINRSGWWQLIGFIPLIGWIVLIYWMCQPGKEPNRFGPAPQGAPQVQDFSQV
jgi:uncharacterized membrane protein YhaH (DUF805 family)